MTDIGPVLHKWLQYHDKEFDGFNGLYNISATRYDEYPCNCYGCQQLVRFIRENADEFRLDDEYDDDILAEDRIPDLEVEDE